MDIYKKKNRYYPVTLNNRIGFLLDLSGKTKTEILENIKSIVKSKAFLNDNLKGNTKFFLETNLKILGQIENYVY